MAISDDINLEFVDHLGPGVFQVRSGAHLVEIDFLENLQALLEEALLKTSLDELGVDELSIEDADADVEEPRNVE